MVETMNRPNVNEVPEDEMVANEVIFNIVQNRLNWISKMLDPKRDIDGECGYPERIDATEYRRLYDRDAISARVVELEPKESWAIQPEVVETDDNEEETPFELAWANIGKSLNGESWYQDQQGSPVWEYLLRADIMSRIGHYGVLLMGFNDGRSLSQPAPGFEEMDSVPEGTEGMYGVNPSAGDNTGYDSYTTEQLIQQGANFAVGGIVPKVAGGEPMALKYLKVFDESTAQITRYERDPMNPRFGLPQMYLVTFNSNKTESAGGAGLPVASAHVHWSRVIHLAEKRGTNEVLAYPQMKQVYNRLWDLMKDYGAAGEGYWQSAFSMLSLETNPQLGGDVPFGDAERKMVNDQMEKIRNKLQRHLVTIGMTAKTLAPSMIDPTPYINVFIEAICIVKGCPVRVFKGSERGELASSQDDSSWNDRMKHRQQFYLTPRVIVPFIDRLIITGVLPKPVGYSVQWGDIESVSDKDRAAIATQEATAMASYVSGNLESIITPTDFYVEVMGWDLGKAERVVANANNAAASQEQMTTPPEGDNGDGTFSDEEALGEEPTTE